MKRNILYFLTILTLFPAASQAQHIWDGIPQDSTMIRPADAPVPGLIPDTAIIPLWQTGRTHKSFFTTDTTAVSMMTDTLNFYPTNANNWFTVKIKNSINVIIDFWHKYQTDSSHAGGIVEFSTDSGMTWQNVKGDCNVDAGFGPGVFTSNFYGTHDTLLSGEQAFMGSSGGVQQYSRFQFFQGIPTKTTSGASCNWWGVDTFYVRFRFVSDTAHDTLAGWSIDSIKIERDHYNGAVAKVNKATELKTYPNPSHNGMFTFPALPDESHFDVEVYNAMGERVMKTPYGNRLNLSAYPKGLYFYRVSNGTEYYSGRLQIE